MTRFFAAYDLNGTLVDNLRVYETGRFITDAFSIIVTLEDYASKHPGCVVDYIVDGVRIETIDNTEDFESIKPRPAHSDAEKLLSALVEAIEADRALTDALLHRVPDYSPTAEDWEHTAAEQERRNRAADKLYVIMRRLK